MGWLASKELDSLRGNGGQSRIESEDECEGFQDRFCPVKSGELARREIGFSELLLLRGSQRLPVFGNRAE